jgi:hypothetical protein
LRRDVFLEGKSDRHQGLADSRNLCAGPNFSFVNFEAQNGKRLKKKKLALKMPICSKRKRRH